MLTMLLLKKIFIGYIYVSVFFFHLHWHYYDFASFVIGVALLCFIIVCVLLMKYVKVVFINIYIYMICL